MVSHFAIARTDLDGANPSIFGERQRQARRRKIVGSGRGNLHFGQLDDHVRLAQLPALREGRRLRHVLRLPHRRAGIHPSRDGRNLAVAQARIVGERSHGGIGKPGRHLSGRDSLFDCPRPRPRVFKGEQRHRRDFAGAMAADAPGVQDWSNVAGEGDVGGGTKPRLAHGRCRDSAEGDDTQTSHRKPPREYQNEGFETIARFETLLWWTRCGPGGPFEIHGLSLPRRMRPISCDLSRRAVRMQPMWSRGIGTALCVLTLACSESAPAPSDPRRHCLTSDVVARKGERRKRRGVGRRSERDRVDGRADARRILKIERHVHRIGERP